MLHAPDKVKSDKRRQFLDTLAETAYGEDVIDSDATGEVFSPLLEVEIVQAMESVERYEDGAALAQRVLKAHPHNPTHVVEAWRALGRCHAKLGRIGEAEHAFDAAIAEATRVGRTYHEMLAICDYTQAVLDQAGRRGEQLPALGRAIKALVLDSSEYTDILSGYGLDVNDAVAAAGEAST